MGASSTPDTGARGSGGAGCVPLPVDRRVQYGEITFSTTTGNARGVALSFEWVDGTLRGEVRSAHGEPPPGKPLRDVTYDRATRRLAFWFTDETRAEYHYALTAACDSLWGSARFYVTDQDPDGQVVPQSFHLAQDASR